MVPSTEYHSIQTLLKWKKFVGTKIYELNGGHCIRQVHIPPGLPNSSLISAENIFDKKFELLSSAVDVLIRTCLFPEASSFVPVPMFSPLLSLTLVMFWEVLIWGVIVSLVFILDG